MATTVNNAFNEFMRDSVNLDPEKTKIARNSRDNLIDNINKFNQSNDFFALYKEQHLKFGSFARNTKIRELDDIDLMICLSAEGTRTYIQIGDCFYIYGNTNDKNNNLLSDNTLHLNSTKVINRFISKLSYLNDYNKAEMHKNHEAATLEMKSYTWNFDIVPCFYTTQNFYLIPDGYGNWKKTDPRIDNEHTSSLNQKFNGKLLNIIRLIKFWNKRPLAPRISSYLLECLILNHYQTRNYLFDIKSEFLTTLNALSYNIWFDVFDPKGIQGNINNLSTQERSRISQVMSYTCTNIKTAIQYEKENKHEEAINIWKNVLGDKFPKYINL